MQSFQVKATKLTPEINFDPSSNVFKITGWSLPENVENFYKPVIAWINEYIEKSDMPSNQGVKVIIGLTYYNSSSARYLVEILTKLKKIDGKNQKLQVVWLVDKEDKQLKDNALEMADILDIPIKIKET